ncbi:TPA: hypothetical protein ACH3X1_006252 [Trebouxia sp. C0004]
MGGPALLPGALLPPKQKRSFPWSSPALPVPKPARAVPRRRGQDPFADIIAGVQEVIQNIGGGPKYDLVLSSGFLAFASHSGFLKAVEESKVPVASIVGTSSGAISGSLYAAGYSAEQVAAELARVAPIQLLRPNMQPWKGGVLSLDPVVERLRQLLPATFEELPVPLAVGVVDQTGKHMLIRSGPLPEAVAASAAIPMVFAAVDIPGKNNQPASCHNTYALVSFPLCSGLCLASTMSAVLHTTGEQSTIVSTISKTCDWHTQKLCCACRCFCWTSR